MSEKFEPRMLGKTGISVGPLGVGAGYGVGADAIEEAFDRGVRYCNGCYFNLCATGTDDRSKAG